MRTSLLSSLFAVLVVAVNWESRTITKTASTTLQTGWDGGLAVVLCCTIALLLLARAIYKTIRRCLDQGIRVPFSLRLLDLDPCLLLLPLLVHSTASYSETRSDGAIITHIHGFGSDQSGNAMLLAALTIAAFQFRAGLARYLSGEVTTDQSPD